MPRRRRRHPHRAIPGHAPPLLRRPRRPGARPRGHYTRDHPMAQAHGSLGLGLPGIHQRIRRPPPHFGRGSPRSVRIPPAPSRRRNRRTHRRLPRPHSPPDRFAARVDHPACRLCPRRHPSRRRRHGPLPHADRQPPPTRHRCCRPRLLGAAGARGRRGRVDPCRHRARRGVRGRPPGDGTRAHGGTHP